MHNTQNSLNAVTDKADNQLVFAFWTCLQLERLVQFWLLFFLVLARNNNGYGQKNGARHARRDPENPLRS